ncbi:site-specific integrase [Trichlorobacter lovleyi]|uniref:tyrosine-type recombinase/integrase n=1 Tax=Trichlorobacter lovleyi TaxID=313985 RepID=UPI0024818EDA|nr:site-specific integrase [Trichlorobacter lovleyi]
MKKKILNDKLIRSLKPEAAEYMITGSDGFYVRVLPSGIRTFWYRFTLNGKRLKMNLGQYPDISLAEAHDLHAKARLQVRAGEDPRQQQQDSEQSPEDPLTVEALAEKWTEWSKKHHSTRWANTLDLALKKDVLPIYGQRLATEIRRRDAMAILEAKAATAPGQATNLHKALRGMFQYAVERELVEFNPFSEIRASRSIPAMKLESRERILTDEEIKFLWTAIDQGGGSDSTRRALKVMLLTGQRNGEVCGMHSREIQIGIGKPRCQGCRRCGWWTIPKERRQGNKGGEHRIFLSQQTMQFVDQRKGFVFPGDTDIAPITANSVNHHVRRVVPATGKTPYYGLSRWTPHDLRRTCATGVRRLGATRDEMDLVLGHRVGGVTGVYDRHVGEPEKERWLTAWGEYIQRLVSVD